MKLKTIQILWHAKQPIFTADFQPNTSRLATGGGDSTVRIWNILKTTDSTAQIEFLSTLKRHSAPVNCVRWSPSGNYLATGGDGFFSCIYSQDGTILVWQKSKEVESDEDMSVETWKIASSLRGSTSEMYDIAWSPDELFIISANMDNSARIYSIQDQRCIHVLTDHSHFVQGVAWDPKSMFLATQSSDRSVCIYKYSNPKTGVFLVKKAAKHLNLNNHSLTAEENEVFKKNFKMYHDETLLSFFRRPSFSPDGSLLLTPAGIMPAVMNSGSCSPFPKEKEESLNHCVYMFSRSSLISKPVAIIPNLKKPCIAIRWNPIQYQLTKKDPLVDLPYRYIYALATQDSVYIYDTQQLAPLAYLSQLHYSTFTDLAWSCDGLCLVVTSTDGFSSLVIFDAGELGIPVETNVVKEDVSNCSVNVVGSIVDSIVDSAAGPLEEVVDDSVIEYVKMHMDVDKPVDQNLSHSGMLNLKAVNILQESMQNATNVKSSMDTNVKSSMDANVKEDENTMADVKDVKVNENVKADGTDVKKIKRIVPTLVSAGTQ